MVSYLLQELVFGKSSVKRRNVRHDFQEFWCHSCKRSFGLDGRFHANTRFGWNLTALYFYLAVELGIQQRTVARMFEKLFDLSISTGGGAHLKKRIAAYYAQTVQKIMDKITAGHLIQADETKARKKGAAGYVWVFTNSHEVVYLYSESREADILRKIMDRFRGVLVSDFYAAYDSIECQQQRCLIHLLRDLNNEVLGHGSSNDTRTHPRSALRSGGAWIMAELSTHTHECPRCGTKWECGEANYQDVCPYPIKTLCTRCWAKETPIDRYLRNGLAPSVYNRSRR
jgi:hypothetical protein